MKARNLLLKTVGPNGESYGGFIWPLTVGSIVEAPDWNPSKKCGGGLHGLLEGRGDGRLLNWSLEAKWLVIEALEALVDLGGKVKCRAVIIRYCGDRAGATTYLYDHTHAPGIVGLTLTGGDRATLTGGYGATLTGGDDATLTGGDRATLTGGDGATLTGGDHATLTGGDRATLTGGDDATLTGGDHATLTGGDRATLTGGDGATFQGGKNSVFIHRRNGIITNVDNLSLVANVRYQYLDGKWVKV